MSNSQAGRSPLISCLRLLVQYICSSPAYLEDVPPSATCGCATVWLHGTTFYGYYARTFGLFIFVSNHNSSDFIVLLSHYFSTQSSPHLIYLSYLGKSCSVPYFQQSWSYQQLCPKCFYIAIIFKFVGANILLKRWKQMINARRLIPLYDHNQCKFLNYEILRHVNLFSDRSSYFELCQDRF